MVSRKPKRNPRPRLCPQSHWEDRSEKDNTLGLPQAMSCGEYDPARNKQCQQALEHYHGCEPAHTSTGPPANTVAYAGNQISSGYCQQADSHTEIREKSTSRRSQEKKTANEERKAHHEDGGDTKRGCDGVSQRSLPAVIRRRSGRLTIESPICIGRYAAPCFQ